MLRQLGSLSVSPSSLFTLSSPPYPCLPPSPLSSLSPPSSLSLKTALEAQQAYLLVLGYSLPRELGEGFDYLRGGRRQGCNQRLIGHCERGFGDPLVQQVPTRVRTSSGLCVGPLEALHA